MSKFRPGLAVSMLALTALWGCQTPAKVAADRPTVRSDNSIEQFLRTAANSSQGARNYGAAVNYYQSLYARNPKDVQTILGLARNLRYIGSPGDALEILKKGREAYPDRLDIKTEYGKALLAITHHNLDEGDRARTVLRNIMQYKVETTETQVTHFKMRSGGGWWYWWNRVDSSSQGRY